MAGKVYALLVGINEYDDSVGRLNGCLKDVEYFEGYLRSRFDESTLNVERLLDGDATYANVVGGFRKFLTRAEDDDVALFLYCGHGARWKCADEFSDHSRDGFDETMVCVDSRVKPGVYDLADKELAALLHDVAAKGAHVAAIMDSCHSGGATRGPDDLLWPTTRNTHQEDSQRPYDSYLDGYYAAKAPGGQGLVIPKSRHVLLAACTRHQKAKEGPSGGVFSATLQDVLEGGQSELTYSELFARARLAVRRRVRDQDPQFESHDGFNVFSDFLSTKSLGRTPTHLVYYDDEWGDWKLKFGAALGLPTDATEPIDLTILGKDDEELTRAVVTEVNVQESEIELDDELPKGEYMARLNTFPAPRMPVRLTGTEAGLQALRDGLDADQSAGIRWAGDGEEARYTLEAGSVDGEDLFTVTREDPPLEITGIPDGFEQPAVDDILGVLGQVARWERLLLLQNPNTKMNPSEIELTITASEWNGEPAYSDVDGQIKIVFDEDSDGLQKWANRDYEIRATNNASQVLHLALLHFSEEFGITLVSNEPLRPGEDAILDAEAFWLADERVQGQENFILVVSTEHVDAEQLAQDDITLRGKERGTRGRAPRRKKYTNEWYTKRLQVRTVGRTQRLGAEPAAVEGGAVTVQGHPTVRGSVSIVPAPANTRSAGGGFHQVLSRAGLELVGLDDSSTRSAGAGGASVIELSDLTGTESLAETPLEIDIGLDLSDEHELVPLAFDGEHLLLVGDSERLDDGSTRVRVDYVPEGAEEGRRSLGRALKLYLFRTYLGRDGTALRWVDFQDDGSVVRQASGVQDKVAAAKSVLLLVHGIIGDTEGMAEGVGHVAYADRPLAEHFDVVLTYDYENLSRPIQDTASDLKKRLDEAGALSDDVQLTIMAHSMGGLVSRWFVEQLGGADWVDHLVLCGTPNGGSPFGHVGTARKLFSILGSVAANAAMLQGVLPFVLGAIQRSKKLTVTLEQMKPGSEFLESLSSSPDPATRYTILAGDIGRYGGEAEEGMAKLLTKAGKGLVLETLHAQAPHDIAVSLDSIRSVPKTRTPSPQSDEVACHHLNYFVSEAGRAALGTVTW